MSLPQRHCWIIQGDTEWLYQQAYALYQSVSPSSCFWLSDAEHTNQTVHVKQAHQHLGQECELLLFEVSNKFDADAFGAVVGCVKAGGTVVILLNSALSSTRWLRRFLRTATDFPAIQQFHQPQSLPSIPKLHAKNITTTIIEPTQEQEQAIALVQRVVTGHRRRPLVLTADRGRGKSALLGMAAAELLKAGKQHVLVTAPSPANIQTLLFHAHQQLPSSKLSATSVTWQDAMIEFMAPDAILQAQPTTDLLIIDEAAAIPANMLEQYLIQYSRLVFSSTIHGYEGTGRGFALRFYKTLDKLAPDWRALSLQQPIRWGEGDIVEQFCFAALLLDAEPIDSQEIDAATLNELNYVQLEQGQLLNDESLLRQVFGLMALAHYRTRPSDLHMLLGQPDIRIGVLRFQGKAVATLWTIAEPQLEDTLAQAVYDGQRRLKGHLLPQSLLVHTGIIDAAQCDYQRISRIAVHPDFQQKGWGQYLLKCAVAEMTDDTDVVGVSFAMSEDLLHFWHKAGFETVRLGQHRDEVSGSLSVMMLKPLTPRSQTLVEKARKILACQWSFLLSRQWDELDAESVIQISQTLLDDETFSIDVLPQIQSFAFKQRPYESSEWALWQWFRSQLSSPGFEQLHKEQQQLLIMLILQGLPFDKAAKQLKLSGRKQIITQLRKAVSQLLDIEADINS